MQQKLAFAAARKLMKSVPYKDIGHGAKVGLGMSAALGVPYFAAEAHSNSNGKTFLPFLFLRALTGGN